MKLFRTLRLRRAARTHFGWSTLRSGQLTAMRAILAGRDAVVVLPTGAGKSAIYQVPATLLAGPTLVISPLLALQHDQIAALNARGVAAVRAERLSSAQTPKQQTEALGRVRSGEARLLFVTPEQLASPERLAALRELRPSLVAVDEAHCISTWGHEFRPDYLALGHAIAALGRPPIVALTATASPPVREDIASRLGLTDPVSVIGGLDRPNLRLEAAHCPTEELRWRRLVAFLDERDGAGIVYVATRRTAEELAERLIAAGYPAAYYHGGMSASMRRERHADFTGDQAPIMVATSAFGMGIDKANIRWVAHMALPDSPDSYLQEIGRAGRDGAPARVLLLYRAEDMALQRFFAGGAPAADDLVYVAAAIRGGVTTKAEVATRTGMSARKVASLLGLLESVGAVATGDRGELTLPVFAPLPENAATLAVAEAERHHVLQRSRTDMMRRFAEASTCRVQPLLGYFGEQMPGPCGHCDNCITGPVAPKRSRRKASAAPYPLHSVVRHAEWGLGTVLGYEADRMTVLFDQVGYKTLSTTVVRENDLLQPEPV
jgi:ATP-dependent DNA helicase RecQ